MEHTTYIMPFGRHKNKPIEQCPSKYLDWVVNRVKKNTKKAAEMVAASNIELRRRGFDRQVAQP